MSVKDLPAGERSSLWLFFLLTFGLSWMVWIPVAVSGRPVSLPVLALGAFAPTIAGIALTHLTRDRAARRDYWRRALDVRLISGKWYAVVFLIYPLIMAATFVVEILTGQPPPSLAGAARIITHPLPLLGFIASMIVGGPLAEELGWRGFALDRLQQRWNALVSSLILGIMWGLWHLPLFLMKGTSQGEMGFGTPLFWLWFIQVVSHAILYTWVFNNNRRSTLSAILMHFMGNSVFTVVAQLGHSLPQHTVMIQSLLQVSVTVVVIGVWGPATMTRGQSDRHTTLPASGFHRP